MVSAAVAKVAEIEALEPTEVKVLDHVTVIGGGVSGLKAALDLARRGLKVSLIEKTPFLGGQVSRLHRISPTGEDAAELIAGLINQVLDHPDIQLLTCSQVTGQEGYIGNFTLTVLKGYEPSEDELITMEKGQPAGTSKSDFIPFQGICPKVCLSPKKR